MSQLEVNALQVLVNDQHVVLFGRWLLGVGCWFKLELSSRARGVVAGGQLLALLLLQVAVGHVVHVESPVGYLAVELAGFLEAHAPNDVHHHRLVYLYLPVAELTLQRLFGKEAVSLLCFLQRQAYLRLRPAGFHYLQPLLLGFLVGLRHHLYLVAALQFVAYGDHLIINTRAYTLVADARVNVVGKVQHRGPLGKLQQVALRRKDEHLVFIQIHAKLVHGFPAIAVFQHLAYGVQPLVHAALCLHALIAPVGRHAALCYLVHAFGAYLYLHPFLFRSQHGDVQALVAVRLRHGEPVAQAFRVGLVHVGHDGVCLPALHFLLIFRTVNDDANGKEVIHPLEGAALLLHLLPDGVNALGAPLHVKLQPSLLQLLPYGAYEVLNVGVAAFLRGVQLVLDVVVGVVLQVLQRQVFQL